MEYKRIHIESKSNDLIHGGDTYISNLIELFRDIQKPAQLESNPDSMSSKNKKFYKYLNKT